MSDTNEKTPKLDKAEVLKLTQEYWRLENMSSVLHNQIIKLTCERDANHERCKEIRRKMANNTLVIGEPIFVKMEFPEPGIYWPVASCGYTNPESYPTTVKTIVDPS